MDDFFDTEYDFHFPSGFHAFPLGGDGEDGDGAGKGAGDATASGPRRPLSTLLYQQQLCLKKARQEPTEQR